MLSETVSSSPTPSSTGIKGLRSDGAEARNRLLDTALALFAERGFAKTSTRAIAQGAGVNVAAISYYFGDKAGLYQAVFDDPRSNPGPNIAGLEAGPASLDDVLRALLVGFTEPLKQGQTVQNCMRLHFREMLEPTGVWQNEIEQTIKPAHHALAQALSRHLGLPEPDDDVHRLAFSITALGMMMHIGCEVIPAIRPSLVASPPAIDAYAQRLLQYAWAMVDSEAMRRAATAP